MDYQLLDSGQFRKLEKFGDFVISRPAPFATWQPSQSVDIWRLADANYIKDKRGAGKWLSSKPDLEWQLTAEGLVFSLKLADSGQVGVFPDHAINWQWIADICQKAKRPINVLNLFAYTGGSTLAAVRGGANVTHVDSAKSVVNWAHDNLKLNGFGEDKVRWIVDDVLKFVKREIKRGRKYDGIILDPPSFGRGSKGEVWNIKKNLAELLDDLTKIMTDRPLFEILTAHSEDFNPNSMLKLLEYSQKGRGKIKTGPMELPKNSLTRRVVLGHYARWQPTFS